MGLIQALSRHVFSKQKPSRAVKLLVIGNCQVQAIKHGLTVVCDNIEVEAVPVHILEGEKRDAAFMEFVRRKDEYDVVLSINLSDDFGAFSRERIVETFHPVPVFTISNLYFTGLHPDITYVGGLNKRTPGPIGDYHSKLAVLGFLMKLPEARATRLYCDQVYQRMGYYSAWDESLQEMAVRDAQTDVPVGALFESRLRTGACFFSHNHPTSYLLTPYIFRIAGFLAEKGLVRLNGFEPEPEETINFLAASAVFPVYPEIAAFHHLSYGGSYVFRTETVGDQPARAMSLLNFVEGEYQAFRAGDQRILQEQYPGIHLMATYANDREFRSFAMAL